MKRKKRASFAHSFHSSITFFSSFSFVSFLFNGSEKGTETKREKRDVYSVVFFLIQLITNERREMRELTE